MKNLKLYVELDIIELRTAFNQEYYKNMFLNQILIVVKYQLLMNDACEIREKNCKIR